MSAHHRPFADGRRSSTIFDKGTKSGSSGSVAPGGQTSIFGVMKNRRGQEPGVPIDYGYRPADRPMAEHLGAKYAADNRDIGFGNTGRVPEKDPTYWRKKTVGIKTFSWETK
jgi:hypothetical protein